MKTYTYSVTINKPREFVFNKIMEKSVYPEWAKAWGEGMTYEGEWKQDTYISFFDTSGSGTKALVNQLVIPECIKMTHVAMVGLGNVEVVDLDETMKKWIGAKEEYYFSNTPDGATTLEIRMETDEMFEGMGKAWPIALQYFKDICEK